MSLEVIRFGTTAIGSQRYRCSNGHTFIGRNAKVGSRNEQIWFKRWIVEGYTLRQLAHQSPWSYEKIKQIKTYWLSQQPPVQPLSQTSTYLIIDGTYFTHTHCCMIIWDAQLKRVIAHMFTAREEYHTCRAWFQLLKAQGLDPVSITVDGNTNVWDALRDVWPVCTIQRCTYHIQRQSEMWLRRHPRTVLAQELKSILQTLSAVHSLYEKAIWWKWYQRWKIRHQQRLRALNSHDKVESDIIRCYRLIDHAYPHMFHYLHDPRIPRTSNAVEGYFSHLKKRYRNHAGIRISHLHSYLLWFIFFSSS